MICSDAFQILTTVIVFVFLRQLVEAVGDGFILDSSYINVCDFLTDSLCNSWLEERSKLWRCFLINYWLVIVQVGAPSTGNYFVNIDHLAIGCIHRIPIHTILTFGSNLVTFSLSLQLVGLQHVNKVV